MPCLKWIYNPPINVLIYYFILVALQSTFQYLKKVTCHVEVPITIYQDNQNHACDAHPLNDTNEGHAL